MEAELELRGVGFLPEQRRQQLFQVLNTYAGELHLPTVLNNLPVLHQQKMLMGICQTPLATLFHYILSLSTCPNIGFNTHADVLNTFMSLDFNYLQFSKCFCN